MQQNLDWSMKTSFSISQSYFLTTAIKKVGAAFFRTFMKKAYKSFKKLVKKLIA